jgi:hypothetical protein
LAKSETEIGRYQGSKIGQIRTKTEISSRRCNYLLIRVRVEGLWCQFVVQFRHILQPQKDEELLESSDESDTGESDDDNDDNDGNDGNDGDFHDEDERKRDSESLTISDQQIRISDQ